MFLSTNNLEPLFCRPAHMICSCDLPREYNPTASSTSSHSELSSRSVDPCDMIPLSCSSAIWWSSGSNIHGLAGRLTGLAATPHCLLHSAPLFQLTGLGVTPLASNISGISSPDVYDASSSLEDEDGNLDALAVQGLSESNEEILMCLEFGKLGAPSFNGRLTQISENFCTTPDSCPAMRFLPLDRVDSFSS